MRFWLGGYGADGGGLAEGIGVLRAGASDDPLAGGDLASAGTAVRAPSPSWIAAHPTRDVLYAAQEQAGTVAAFVRTGEETFAPLGQPVAAGEAVCHAAVAPDGSALIASCWGDGRVVRMPLDATGRPGAPHIAAAAEDPYAADTRDMGILGFAEADLPLLGGAGVVRGSPQEGLGGLIEAAQPARISRAHEARYLRGGVIVTTDLGYDLVRFWTVAGDELNETQRVMLPRGSGPRHTVWHPSGHLFVVTEYSLEVFVLAADPSAAPGTRWRVVGGSPLGAHALLGADAVAEIALTGDAAHAIVGVRGSNTLATLRVRDGGAALVPVAIVESGVDWPRHHIIERDTVLVAGQRSHEVASLSLDERTGVPARVRRRVDAPSPTVLLADRR